MNDGRIFCVVGMGFTVTSPSELAMTWAPVSNRTLVQWPVVWRGSFEEACAYAERCRGQAESFSVWDRLELADPGSDTYEVRREKRLKTMLDPKVAQYHEPYTYEVWEFPEDSSLMQERGGQ